jgi:hypothetical protein
MGIGLNKRENRKKKKQNEKKVRYRERTRFDCVKKKWGESE